MIISQLNVVLKATTSAFTRGMEKAQKRMKGFRAGTVKLGTALKSMGRQAAVAAAVIAGAAWGAKKIFDLGASIEETGSKFRTVFGSAAGSEVTAFLDNFANKAGLTVSAAQGLVSTTGAIAQGLGFTQKASGEVAIEITKLAGDLSSFNNLPTEQVLRGINSALTGEKESLKLLGITYTDEEVKARAFANTGKTVATNLTMQEKATASLQLITERAGVAVGDLARTQDSAANKAKRFGAQFREIAEAFATALMPAFKQVLGKVEENTTAFEALKQKIIDNTSIISAWGMVFVEAVKLAGTFIFELIVGIQRMGESLQASGRVVKAFLGMDFAEVSAQMAILAKLKEEREAGDARVFAQARAFGSAISTAFNGGLAVAQDFQQTMADVPRTIEDAAVAAGVPIDQLAVKMEDVSKNIADNFVGRMTDMVKGSKDAFGGFFTWIKNQLVELAIKFLIFKSITGLFKSAAGAGWLEDLTGFSSVAESAGSGVTEVVGSGLENGISKMPWDMFSGAKGNMTAGPQVTQVINFTVSAIDGRDAARFIREQGGEIANVVATAAKDSVGYRAALQGA
jgi:hypothetical protein